MIAGAAVLALAPTLAACTGGDGLRAVGDAPETAVLPAADAAEAALSLSAALLEHAEVVALAGDADAAAMAAVAAEAGVPMLVGSGDAVAEELDRLGAETLVVGPDTDPGELAEEREVTTLEDLEAEGAAADVPAPEAPGEGAPVTVLVDPEQDATVVAVARAVAGAAAADVAEMPGGEPRRDAATVEAATAAAGDDPAVGILALGESFGDTAQLLGAIQQATTVPQLPGGGQLAFPGRRMIAAYGSPGIPSLGILGEQDLDASITRVQELAAEYGGLSSEQIVPAFEVITTVASSSAGSDGDYSQAIDVATIREWVDAAAEAGVYVVLDLQPGTTDFLTQATMYEELLLEPHVGLALDSEWRLEPGQRHLEQIGSVTAAEVNETATWLADLTVEHGLPQKVLILHQFSLAMISDREDVDTSRPELAITLHADGHGSPGDKLATYDALQQDLPEGIWMAWKNFYDEDTPTFTPEETFEVEPRPWFVSYQ